MPDLKERFTSRKFLLTVAGCFIILLKALGVISLEDEAIWQLITIILGFLGVEGARDIVATWREGRVEMRKRKAT